LIIHAMRRPFGSPTATQADSLAAEPTDLALHVLGRQCGEMVIEMELTFERQLDEHSLARAVDLLLDAEPVLGCRLDVCAPTPRWTPVVTSLRRRLTFTHAPEEYEQDRRTGLDATTNVQLATCLLRRTNGDRLLVKMTHEVGDGVGLQYLVSRLAAIYAQLGSDPAYRPNRNLNARRDFAQIVSNVPRHGYPGILWAFVRFMAPRWFPRATHVLPLEQESAGPWVPIVKHVPAAQLRFLSRYGKARGSTLNDMFLAAAYRALASTRGRNERSALRISTTVDLRRWCRSPTPPSICNLSSFEHPFLMRKLGDDFDATLARVTAMTRRRKNSWPGLAPALIGHFSMRRRNFAAQVRGATDQRRVKAEMGRSCTVWRAVAAVLSNEGRLDAARLQFGAETVVAAHILPPFLKLPDLHICLSGFNGALTMAAVTPANGEDAVGTFLDAVLQQLPAEELATENAHSPLPVVPAAIGSDAGWPAERQLA
jgi:NRPS condensation-like uncharacterized protein